MFGLLSACVVLAAGCRSPQDSGRFGDVHRLVEDKIEQHASRDDALTLWDEVVGDEYQDQGAIERSRQSLQLERERRDVAAEVFENAASLDVCLAFCLEFNDRIQARRAALRSVGGEELVTRSRFLPSLVYSLRREATDPDEGTSTNRTHSILRLTQTLVEFGVDNPADVELREAQREALFAFEDTVREVLSEVRKTFFSIVLRKEQLAERQKLLNDFQNRLEQIGKLEESRRALELDVLTAKLNVLNEEARINGLQREILRKTNDLLYLLGFPVGMTGAAVQGEVEPFDLSPEEAVRLALRRSSSVARARAEASEQARETREVLWEFAPELGLQAGWKDDRNAAGVEVETTEGLYAVSTFAEAHSDPFDGLLEAEIDLLDEEEEGWFLGLTVELPIFEGMGRKGLLIREKAKLEEALHTLRDTVDNLELQVRKRYQSMLERRKEVDILRETVNISRKRLRVQERLKELGKISDNELETFRNRFFQDQDAYFTEQIRWIEAQEDLRFEMRFFEPLPEE